ncbi:SpoIID/LytB domain-containing protein [bacterium]|nr:SpoIID/LytB domain-containing protein [bacterium]
MKRIISLFILIIIIALAGCSVEPVKVEKPVPVYVKRKEPYIKIGLVQTKNPVIFKIKDYAEITSYDGAFIARGIKGSQWRAEVSVSSPSLFFYLLVAGSMTTYDNAEEMSIRLKKEGIPTFILPVSKRTAFSDNSDSGNRIFRVCLDKKFTNRDKAADFRDKISSKLETFIIKYEDKKTAGKITLTNLKTGQILESFNPINISGSPVTIYNVPVGKGFHWESTENRTYPKRISLQIDSQGRLTIINILPVEEYLKGVLPSEMPDTFPLEALKAQAVAARSEALAKIGHAHPNDPFDLCADVHCQVYSGQTKRSKLSDRAVKETRGLVLWDNHMICDAVYAAVCGGHTEDAKNVWGGTDTEYLRGRYDGPSSLKKDYGSLQNEDNLRRWLTQTPMAFCNSTGNVPASLNYTKKYFRWEKNLSQAELQKSIKNATGRDLGEILDIEVLSRGVSGRIIQMQITGTKGRVLLNRELKIRKALSSTTLWSSCFFVDKTDIINGIPEQFILKGGGFGHGVGMCQTGAAMMALKGASFVQILNHYYSGARLRRFY